MCLRLVSAAAAGKKKVLQGNRSAYVRAFGYCTDNQGLKNR
jgi:hypothetical protein